jgi:integrase
MASIAKDRKDGYWRIIVPMGKKRVSIRLGKLSIKNLQAFQTHIENLASAKKNHTLIPDDTIAWLKNRPSDLRGKLEKAGLCEPKPAEKPVVRLGDFVKAYIGKRADIKPGTKTCLELVKKRMVKYFGADRDIESITEQDAEDFKQHLIGIGKAENTARRSVAIARQFFRAAVRGRLLAANPFDGIPVSLKEVRDRHIFLNHKDSMKILESCPDSQWRAIFALCRWGGLRCPSEVLSLRWADIDWNRNRITVRSPKTERHEGHESRVVPLFPELRGPLQDVFDQAKPGTEWVITKYRLDNTNLRTQFQRILLQAGVKPWPKPFQNLRSTRETELTEKFPVHVVCEWIGNSVLIARKHYLQTTEEHYAKATGGIALPCAPIAHTCAPNASQSEPATGSHWPPQILDKTAKNADTTLKTHIRRLLAACGNSGETKGSRGERIRTFGLLDPNQAL